MSPRTITLAAFTLLSVSLVAPDVFAASGSTVLMPKTDTGYTLEDSAMRMERQKRASLLTISDEVDAWETSNEKGLKKSLAERATVRTVCRKQLISANKDQQLSIVIKCIRADIQQERTWLLSQMDAAAKLTGVATRTREILIDRLKKLQTALTVLNDAFDTGVFRNEKNLRDALNNLRIKYRSPLWDANNAVRKERHTAALGLLLLDMRSASGSVIEPMSWDMAQSCVWTNEQIVLQRKIPQEGSGSLTMQQCFSLLQDAIQKQIPVTTTGAVIPTK